MSAHWGEFDTKVLRQDLLTAADFDLTNYESCADPLFAVPPVIDKKEEILAIDKEQTCVRNGLVEHTIQLERYRTRLHILLGTAVQAMSDCIGGQATPVFADIPSFPDCINCQRQQSKISDQDIYEKDFVRGIGTAPPQISSESCRQLLKKSVAQICLHQGYQGSQPSALDSLIAACEEFYTKFLVQLRHNVDSEAMNGHSGFQDSMHRTLSQMGQGDMGALLEDYRHTTILRHNKLLHTCRQLETAYTHILSTGELPEQLSNILPSPTTREASSSVFPLSDTEERADVAGSSHDPEDSVLGEDDDAQKLLELAGLSGFDITIKGDLEEEPSASTSSMISTGESTKAKSKAKARTAAATAKRRKKH